MQSNVKVNILQRRIKSRAQSSDALSFYHLLTSSQLLTKLEELQPDFRARRYPPLDTLSLFLYQTMSADQSCQQAVNTLAVQRLSEGLSVSNTYTGSYCKARQRLPTPLVSGLARCTGECVANEAASHWHWQGRSVKLVDGTTVTMPDTPENQVVYPQQSGQQVGIGFPLCRWVGIICLASGGVLDAAMGPFKGKGADEQTLLRKIQNALKPGDIVVGDAYFAGYFFLANLIEQGVDGVFEPHGARRKSTDFREGKRLGSKDHLICYTKPKKRPEWMSEEAYEAAADEVVIRELKVGKKLLVTTLLSVKSASKEALKQLYKERWHVELDLRHIKTTMKMHTFRCKTPEMVEKEMWVHILAYNLIRLLMAQSALLVDILPRQISFKHTLQIWVAYRYQKGGSPLGSDKVLALCALIAENCVGNRPGRIEPRVVKRRPKPYPLLMQPRDVARGVVKKYGHPKKQK